MGKHSVWAISLIRVVFADWADRDMEPCSPSVLSVGAANWSVYTPNVAVGDNSAVPQGGTWKYFSWGYDNAVNGVVAGGTNIPNKFIAIRVS